MKAKEGVPVEDAAVPIANVEEAAPAEKPAAKGKRKAQESGGTIMITPLHIYIYAYIYIYTYLTVSPLTVRRCPVIVRRLPLIMMRVP